MHMNVPAAVMPVRVGADKGLVSGEVFPAKFLAQRLRPVCGQAVVCAGPWVKGNDIVVALYVLPFLVFPIAEICPHTGDSKIIAPAVEGRNAVVLPRYKPPGFIKDGLHGKFVVLEQQILFDCPVVCIFRAEMFEYRQPLHLLSARLHT